MKAIILAAGYATRLYPLTLNVPKALLPIGGKPIIDYIVDEIATVGVIDEIYVVSNHKFYPHFCDWAREHKSSIPISVLDDGTTNEETRRGAIGDILFTIKEKNIQDELMIIAGDNFFTYKLKDYYDFYKKKDCDCVCVKEIMDKSSLSSYGIALMDENAKVLEIEEKPANPKSSFAVYAAYIYQKETIPLFSEYILQGNNPDAPGHFPEWLCQRKPVYAFQFSQECYDIGTPESYRSVCERYEA